MPDDAMRFLVRDASGATALDAGTALTAALPVASVTPTGGVAGLLPDLLGTLLPRAVFDLPNDPGATDIPAGTIRVAKNAATGRLTLWTNGSGVMVDLLTVTPAS